MAELSWLDPAVPPREDIVLRYLLEKWEQQKPDHPFIVFDQFESETEWSYQQTAEISRRSATALSQLGVGFGDHVMCFLPNGPEILKAWFAANWLGAAYAPINIAYRGSLLQHVVDLTTPKVIVTQSTLAERLLEIDFDESIPVILVDVETPDSRFDSLNLLGKQALDAEIDHAALTLPKPIEPWDLQAIIYTSGTTGPSKGVLSSYCHGGTSAMVAFEEADAEDLRYLIILPMFHIAGAGGIISMSMLGRTAILCARFDTQSFWQTVERTQATGGLLLGAIETFLLKQPVLEGEANNNLQWAFSVPYTDNSRAFSERFNVRLRTGFNMTEISNQISSPFNPTVPLSCGRQRPGVDLMLADENDNAVPDGEVGELLIRTHRPWSLFHGYLQNPEATAKSWRNGWFHTGDLFTRTPEGDYFFVDRAKDCIRRRGENISSFEVERECLTHSSIREAAAIGIDSDMGEQDVMVVLALVPSQAFDHVELIEFLRQKLPYFMVPRYIRVMDELPKTPTAKVEKVKLRKAGVTEDTWDREAHGIIIKRDKM